MFYLMLLLFGVAVGILSGFLGIGGGVVLVPGLMLLFGFSQPQAQGTSLAVMIPPIGLFATIVYFQHGHVRLPVVWWVALGFMIGAFLGAHLVEHVSVHWLRFLFGALLLYIGFLFVLSPVEAQFNAALPAGLTALSLVVVAIVKKRQRPPKKDLTPPSDRVEYHI